MRLTVGITQLLPEWEIVIQQIGVSFEIISLKEPISADQFSVVIVTTKGAKNEWFHSIFCVFGKMRKSEIPMQKALHLIVFLARGALRKSLAENAYKT